MTAKAHERSLRGGLFHFVCLTDVSLFTRAAYRRGRCALVLSHACTASQCDLRDPGWGYPGFWHCDFFALAPYDLKKGGDLRFATWLEPKLAMDPSFGPGI